MNLEVDGAEGVHFTIPESEPLPTREQLTEMDAEFQELCPTGYEKVKGTIEGAEMYVPRNSYQYNGIKLSPIITGYAVQNDTVVDKGTRGARVSGFSEDEIKAIDGLAEKNKTFAFHQREV